MESITCYHVSSCHSHSRMPSSLSSRGKLSISDPLQKLQYVVQQPNHDSTNLHPQLISDSRSSDLFHPRRLFFIYKSDHFLYPVQRGSSRVAARMQQTPQPRLRIYDQSRLCRYCVSRVSTDRNSSFRVITAIFIPYNIPQMNCCLCSVDVAASYRRQPPSALSSAQG